MINHLFARGDHNSYRLTAVLSAKSSASRSEAVYRNTPDDTFVPIFLRHVLLSKLKEENVRIVLDHIQEMLLDNSLNIFSRTLLDNKYDASPEHLDAFATIFERAFSNIDPSRYNVRQNLKFLLEINLRDDLGLMNLSELQDLWMTHRGRSAGLYQKDKKAKILFWDTTLLDYVVREEFLPDYFADDEANSRDEDFNRKEIGLVKYFLDYIQEDGSLAGYRSSGELALRLANELLKRLKEGFYNKEEDPEDRHRVRFFCEYALSGLSVISTDALSYLESIYTDEDQIMEHVRMADIYEILCMLSPEMLSKEAHRREEFVRFADAFIFSSGRVTEIGDDLIWGVMPTSYGEGAFDNHFLSEMTGANLPDGGDLRMVSEGKPCDTNYVIALLANTFEPEDVGALMSYCASVPKKQRKELPTISQWELLVNSQDGDIGLLPPEVAIHLVHREP